MSVLYLCVALLLLGAVVALLTYRADHPWRSTTPPTDEQRYLDWVARHAEYERRQRIRKAKQRMRVLRRLDDRYAARTRVHTP